MRQIILHLKARNDINGNPRRLYLPLDKLGNIVNVIDEGYRGESVLPYGSDGRTIISINVSVSEYKKWIKWAKDRDCYNPS